MAHLLFHHTTLKVGQATKRNIWIIQLMHPESNTLTSNRTSVLKLHSPPPSTALHHTLAAPPAAPCPRISITFQPPKQTKTRELISPLTSSQPTPSLPLGFTPFSICFEFVSIPLYAFHAPPPSLSLLRAPDTKPNPRNKLPRFPGIIKPHNLTRSQIEEGH